MAISTVPALDVQAFVSDPRWPSYRERLLERRAQLEARVLREQPPDHPAMCRMAGEIRGLDFALGTPDALKVSDPRSET